MYVEHWAGMRNAVIGAKNRSNYKTTAIVFEGELWPALLTAFTRYSSCTPRGCLFNEALVSSDIAACLQSPVPSIVRSRLSMI